MDFTNEKVPPILSDYLLYIRAIRDLSDKTAQEYYLDLRTFFRFILLQRKLVGDDVLFENISIERVDLELVRSIKTSDLMEFLIFSKSERPKFHKSETTPYGNAESARARKVASLRSFFKYLTNTRGLLDNNPAADLASPKLPATLPKFLTLDECMELLKAVDGPYRERDYCILVLFLNCGLRVSELAGLNLQDINDSLIRVTGKGNKQRILYLNQSAQDALDAYIKVRLPPKTAADRNALFISRNGNRISVQTVKWLVNKYLDRAGLAGKDCSAHKLRHTAATLMYQNGVDIRTLQEFLGHEQVNTTMIYTHIGDTTMKNAAKANPLADIEVQADAPETPDDTDD